MKVALFSLQHDCVTPELHPVAPLGTWFKWRCPECGQGWAYRHDLENPSNPVPNRWLRGEAMSRPLKMLRWKLQRRHTVTAGA